MKNLLVCTLLFASAFTLNAQVANTRIYAAEKLAKVKEKANSPLYAPAVKTLLRDANKALKMTPPSVMDKTMTADSGDKHDYMSMGPYWWPDPSKPDGLPYIRKDGQRNPELDKLDRNKLGDMSKAVTTLGLAYYFSGDEKYAQKAVDFLNVWFLDAKTKMNPHLTYGQTIPGKNKGMGRGAGMIDIYSFTEMIDAMTLMENSKAFTPKVKKGMKEWFTQLVEWMQTSPVAAEEQRAKNNHGLAYDVQLTAYALYRQSRPCHENHSGVSRKAFVRTDRTGWQTAIGTCTHYCPGIYDLQSGTHARYVFNRLHAGTGYLQRYQPGRTFHHGSTEISDSIYRQTTERMALPTNQGMGQETGRSLLDSSPCIVL